MRKITLKKITSIILVLFLSISTSLNNTPYSSEFNIISVLNSNSIESYSDARIEDDFYNAVNKEWLSKVKLDDGYISYGTFEEVCGRVNGDILNIISDIQKNKDNYDKNSDELKVLNLYNNYLDKR
jgi:putative endopeptidase